MTCEETRILVHALIDGELDAGHSREVEAHLATCPRLRGAAARLSGDTPGPCRRRHCATRRRRPCVRVSKARCRRAAPWRRAAAASLKGLAMGSVLSGALAASLVVMVVRQEEDQRILGDVVSAHLRALQGDHLIDVQSSDPTHRQALVQWPARCRPPRSSISSAQGFHAHRWPSRLHRCQARLRPSSISGGRM